MINTTPKGFWSGLKQDIAGIGKKGLYELHVEDRPEDNPYLPGCNDPCHSLSVIIFLDFNAIFDFITTRFRDWVVLSVFFISEIIPRNNPARFSCDLEFKIQFSTYLCCRSLVLLSYAAGVSCILHWIPAFKKEKNKRLVRAGAW